MFEKGGIYVLALKIILEIIVIFICLVLICLIPLLIKGPISMVFFYHKEVQERAVFLGLTTNKTIKRNGIIFRLIAIPLYIVALVISAFVINGARDFLSLFWQMIVIAMAVNILDCIFVDEIWVRKTKMWIIPGTEDLKRNYVPLKKSNY